MLPLARLSGAGRIRQGRLCTQGNRRAVKLPGGRTREDGLDGTRPAVPELAAIGGMDASGQDG
jgi:hypothetical protein